MKANELRIGNWVDVNGKFCKVQSISDDGINYTDETDHYEDQSYNYILWCSIFDPIPLTPEILEKAGFEKGLNGYFFKGGVEYNLKRHMLEGFGYCEILYLHQLQNLYYALTGEELNIEL
jgi:hypothetical protein